MILRKFFFKNFKYAQIINTRFLSSLKDKKKFENGPGLKEFLVDKSDANSSSNEDEIIANKIFLSNLANHTSEEDCSLNIDVPRKVYFEVHGCQMNLNDTEVAYSILDKTGLYKRTHSEKDADVVLIMTCSIRENAEQKIWNRLREFCHQKKLNSNLKIGILGCMAERLKDKIVHKEKMVDVVCGPDSYRLLPSLLDQSMRSGNSAMNVQLSLEETYADLSPLRINPNSKTAFVSIQRGCDNMCSFVRLNSISSILINSSKNLLILSA